jgi:hypothetical protein
MMSSNVVFIVFEVVPGNGASGLLMIQLICGAELLLGICFWREGLEAAFGPERRGAKGG